MQQISSTLKAKHLYKIGNPSASHANYEKVLLDCKITNVSLNNFSYEIDKI